MFFILLNYYRLKAVGSFGLRAVVLPSRLENKLEAILMNLLKFLKNIYGKNEKCTLKDLEYGEKTENHGK